MDRERAVRFDFRAGSIDILGSDIGGVRLNAFPDVELCLWAILVYFSLLSKLTWIATSPALRKYRLRVGASGCLTRLPADSPNASNRDRLRAYP